MPALAKPIDDVSPEPGRVVAKAAFNAAHELGLSQRELAQSIGVSEATVSRMKGGGMSCRESRLNLRPASFEFFAHLMPSPGLTRIRCTAGWMAKTVI